MRLHEQVQEILFLAPPEALETLMFVRPAQVCLEQSIFIFLGQRTLKGPSEHSESDQKALKHLESTKSLKV